MQLCDCVFTPILDEARLLPMDIGLTGKYSDYKAREWADEPEGYLHRSWCRLELFYGEEGQGRTSCSILRRHLVCYLSTIANAGTIRE